jgi:hypothetical protein
MSIHRAFVASCLAAFAFAWSGGLAAADEKAGIKRFPEFLESLQKEDDAKAYEMSFRRRTLSFSRSTRTLS